jgi:hypothetical protein
MIGNALGFAGSPQPTERALGRVARDFIDAEPEFAFGSTLTALPWLRLPG